MRRGSSRTVRRIACVARLSSASVAVSSRGTAGHELSSSRVRPAHGVSDSPQAGTDQVRCCRTSLQRSNVTLTRSGRSAVTRIVASSSQANVNPRERRLCKRACSNGFIERTPRILTCSDLSARHAAKDARCLRFRSRRLAVIFASEEQDQKDRADHIENAEHSEQSALSDLSDRGFGYDAAPYAPECVKGTPSP
jgi:hypothetical protein